MRMPDDARDAADPVWNELRELRRQNEELRRGYATMARVIGVFLAGAADTDELAARRQRQDDPPCAGTVLPFTRTLRQ